MKILLSLKRNFFLYLRIVGIVIFIVVLANIDLSAVWLQMKRVQPKYLFLALLFQFFMLLLKGWRWHLMVNNTGSVRSITQSVGEFLESYAIGVITPGRLGELVKVGYHDG
ncbi:MAG: lysylphosphatidylglycerol synthase domain-containing protein, partial [Bacteroidales bacterium]|nr:lysylphosphatidylglycerol synthase domain-containing protein [Bacteroidales bacterium]